MMNRQIFLPLALVLVIVLTACTGRKTQTVESLDAIPVGDIVYVLADQVLAESDLYLEEVLPLEERTQKAQEGWAKKEQGFQWEAQDLQSKYEKHLITTADAQAKQESLERRMRAYQNSVQKEAATLEEESFVLSNRAQELIRQAVKNVNNGQYKLVLNAGMLIDADSTLNITPLVLEETNRLYAIEKKENKNE